MSDFSIYSNYTEETSFSEVIFGADSPLLEVEVNELQQILNTKFNRILKQLGDGVFPEDETDYIEFNNSNKTITLKDVVVLSKKGLSVRIKNSNVTVPSSSTGTFYLIARLKEVDVTFESILRSYGDTEGNQIPNNIKDPRWSNETSRRKVTEFTLMCSKNIPSDANNYVYVLIGSFKWENSEFSDWKLESSNISQLDTFANQCLINKTKINALNQVGDSLFYNANIQNFTWCNQPSYASVDFEDFTFKIYKKCDWFDDIDSRHGNVFAFVKLNLPIYIAGVKDSGISGKKYKFRATVQIGSGYLYNGTYQENPEPNVSISHPYFYQNIECDVIAGEYLVDTNYLTAKYINIEFAIPIWWSIPIDNGSNGIYLNIYGAKFYEFDDSLKTWVDADTSVFDKVFTQILKISNDNSGYIQFLKVGKDLDYYGADEAFDDIKVDYNKLSNKPSINDVTLIGNKTSEDLHIQGGSGTNDYRALDNLPTLNGETIIGDMTENDPIYNDEKMTDAEVEDMLDEIFGEE